MSSIEHAHLFDTIENEFATEPTRNKPLVASLEETAANRDYEQFNAELLNKRSLIIVSNRGPVTLEEAEADNVDMKRSAGGLVTALLGMAQHVEATWIACAQTEADAARPTLHFHI